MSKSDAARELGSLGGKATAKARTKKQRSEAAKHAAKSRWSQMTAEERSAEMSRRRKLGVKKKRP